VGVDWIHLTQDRERCEHDNEHFGFMEGEEFLTI
jgi:hypothetical protein